MKRKRQRKGERKKKGGREENIKRGEKEMGKKNN